MSKEWLLISCYHCGCDHLVNTKTGAYEPLGVPLEDEVDEPSTSSRKTATSEEVKDDDSGEVPESYQRVDEDHLMNNIGVSDFGTGIQGEEFINDEGSQVKIVHPKMGHHSGIRTETMLASAEKVQKSKPKDLSGRFGTRGRGMKAPGKMNRTTRPTKGSDNPALEYFGDDPSQDYVGLSGQEGHLDAMLQQAYEDDLADRGF